MEFQRKYWDLAEEEFRKELNNQLGNYHTVSCQNHLMYLTKSFLLLVPEEQD